MKVFSLFSGIGGFDLACQRHGHRIIGACEIDRYAKAVYAGHFTGVPIHKDVTKIRPEELPDFDILCAGFPCQDYSIAGKRLGFKESRGKLFFEIVRIAKEKRPRFLLLENVKGLLSHDRGKTFAVILTALDEIGYDAQWQVLNSKYFVPQNRERVFIIANLREEPRPEVFPLGFNGEEVNEDWPNVRTITGGGNAGGMHSQMTGIIINKGITKEQTISNCVDASCWKGHDSHGQRTLIEVARISGHEKRQTGRIYHSDGLARTMCSGSGGMGKNTGMYQINGRVRRLTPLECEKLQGFPDRWTESGIEAENTVTISDTQRYRCLGNAVTVPVVEYIMKKLGSSAKLEIKPVCGHHDDTGCRK